MYVLEDVEWELDGDVGLKGKLDAEFDYWRNRYGTHCFDKDEIEIRRVTCTELQLCIFDDQCVLPEPLVYGCHSRRDTLSATSAMLMGLAILDNINCREQIEAACLEHARSLELSGANETITKGEPE